MAQVPRTVTPVSIDRAESLTVSALAALNGNKPVAPIVALYCLALSWVETGGGRAVIQNNAGNISCYAPTDKNWKGDYWRPPWWHEGATAAEIGQRPSAFRAYPNDEAGWRDYCREFWRRAPLVAAAKQDSPAAFVRALRSTGYSPDYGDAHVKTFSSLIAQFKASKRCGWKPPSGAGALPVIAGVALFAGFSFFVLRSHL